MKIYHCEVDAILTIRYDRSTNEEKIKRKIAKYIYMMPLKIDINKKIATRYLIQYFTKRRKCWSPNMLRSKFKRCDKVMLVEKFLRESIVKQDISFSALDNILQNPCNEIYFFNKEDEIIWRIMK